MRDVINGHTSGGYTGQCIHCRVSLVDCPDNHCPSCIWVDGIQEPDICDCPREEPA